VNEHLSDGDLRAHLDGELGMEGARHLSTCGECRQRLADVAQRAARMQSRFDRLAGSQPVTDTERAWRRFQREYAVKEMSMSQRLWGQIRPALVGVMAVGLIAVAFTFTPVQQAFSAFLGLFRVQQVATLPIDFNRFNGYSGDSEAMERAASVMAESVVVNAESDLLETVSTAAEASALVGFPVRVSDAQPVTQFVARGGSNFTLTLDAERSQAILNDLGRSDLVFPAAADGAAVTVDIPNTVTTSYGTCPNWEAEGGSRPGRGQQMADEVNFETCLLLQQMPSPSVTSDKDFDPRQLVTLGMQVAGMDAAEAQAIADRYDWATTLVVPVPAGETTTEAIAVDGVSGQLVRTANTDTYADGYVIIWVKDGVLYALMGNGDTADGLAIANSLR
jgi:hypothetical protein